MTSVTIVNTKAGNLYSLSAALEKIGCKSNIADTPKQVVGEQLIIPGQGRFGTVMKNLADEDWIEYLNDWKNEDKPILGICVGMQIFFSASAEDQGISGLSWFEGAAEKLNFPKQPMVGWAQVNSTQLPEGAAYFVNSYAIREAKQCIAQTNYGESFCAAVKSNNVSGFQFHPEKSSSYGLKLLKAMLFTN